VAPKPETESLTARAPAIGPVSMPARADAGAGAEASPGVFHPAGSAIDAPTLPRLSLARPALPAPARSAPAQPESTPPGRPGGAAPLPGSPPLAALRSFESPAPHGLWRAAATEEGGFQNEGSLQGDAGFEDEGLFGLPSLTLPRSQAPSLIYRSLRPRASFASDNELDGRPPYLDLQRAAGPDGGIRAPLELIRQAAGREGRPSDGWTTLVASRSAIERQAEEGAVAVAAPAGGEGGGEAAAPGAASADLTKVSNQDLDKLAREVFERLKRRLIIERERAGIGTAFL